MNEMKRIDSYKDFCDIITQSKNAYKSTVSNCLLSLDEVERLSAQNRIYFMESKGGVLIYVDELTHYLMYFFWNPDYSMSIKRKDKDIISKIMYSNPKKEALTKIEEMLKQEGFRCGDLLRQAIKVRDIDDNPKLSLAKRLFYGSGLTLTNADEGHVKEIRELMSMDDTMHVYEIPFITDQEIVELGREGRFVCVLDKNKKVVAFRGPSSSKTSNGYMRIDENYRVNYGIAMILLNYSDTYATEHGQKVENWIDQRNTASARLHLDMGREWGDRYMEFLILGKS